MPAECRSCHAPLLWAMTAAGKRMPIDREPSDDGTVLIMASRELGALAMVLSARALEQARAAGVLLRHEHHYSCPQGDLWRKGKDRDAG